MDADVLAGISPWWWIAFAVVLAAVEMLTVSTVLIWSALAATITAVCLWVAPELSTAAQIAIFAMLSIALTFLGRALFKHYGDGDAGAGTLNRRADRLIGREAEVVAFRFHEGRVTIDGEPWPARLEDGASTPAPGDRVRVVGADGIVVRVQPLVASDAP